jgi:hypothetical protein
MVQPTPSDNPNENWDSWSIQPDNDAICRNSLPFSFDIEVEYGTGLFV